jgi:type I restriction enzyme S subunit
MASNDGRIVSTIGSLIASGVIIGHKDGNYGSLYPRASEFGAVGVPFITAKSLEDGQIDISGAPRLSEQRANELPFGFVQPGDVLLSHNATVGRVALVPEFSGRLLIGTSLTYFRVNEVKLSPRYLAAYLVSSAFQQELAAVMSHSTRNQVPITAQRSLKIVIPPMAEQIAVADILGLLESKIHLCRLMNETLQLVAQTVFKSWFVDFDPVRAKAEGRDPEGMDAATAALFPSEFVGSELGKSPSGWTAGSLRDIAAFQYGYSFKSSDWTECGFPVVKIGNVKPGIISLKGCSYVTEKIVRTLDRVQLHQGDLLVGMTGYVGETGLVPILDGPCYLNQRVGRLSTAAGRADIGFVYCLVRRDEFKTYAEAHAHGSAQANLSGATLLDYRVTIPPFALITRFNSLICPILDAILSKYRQAELLGLLRDTLLPRLISGKLRVPEAEKLVEAVL